MDDNSYADMADENNNVPNVIPIDEKLIASATKIQAVQRGRKSRVEVQEIKEQVSAAKKIQAVHRGNSVRKEAKKRNEGNSEMQISPDEIPEPLSVEQIMKQYKKVTKRIELSDIDKFNQQFPKGYKVDPQVLRQDADGVKILNKIANRLIAEGKYTFGTKYREKAILYMGETLGWRNEEVQKAAVDMVIEKNELAMRILSNNSRSWDEAYATLDRCEKLTKPDAEIKFMQCNRLKARALTYNNLGCYFKKVRKNSNALQCLLKALKIEEGKIDCGNPASTHVNICVILSAMSRHTHALEHAKSAIALLEYENSLMVDSGENSKNSKVNNLLAVSYFNKGAELEHLRKNKSALKAYSKARRIAKETFPKGHPLLSNIENSYEHCARVLRRK